MTMRAGSRILILGATGMLGHKLAQVLSPSAEVIAAFRGDAARWPSQIRVAHIAPDVDVRNSVALTRLLDNSNPDVVLNAAGVVKQILSGYDPVDTIAINAIYPNILALLCEHRGIRLIHYSTDCVFTGTADSKRGTDGYRETDRTDSRDLYGMTKLAGEPKSAASLTLRTSIIGRELRGYTSLVEWFLAQGQATVQGYRRALFTGLTTLELSRVTATILRDHAAMTGVWHVAAPPISKYDLLQIIKTTYQRPTMIQADDDFYCDRRLDGAKFRQATGWEAPSWHKMISSMRADWLDYESLHIEGRL